MNLMLVSNVNLRESQCAMSRMSAGERGRPLRVGVVPRIVPRAWASIVHVNRSQYIRPCVESVVRQVRGAGGTGRSDAHAEQPCSYST